MAPKKKKAAKLRPGRKKGMAGREKSRPENRAGLQTEAGGPGFWALTIRKVGLISSLRKIPGMI